MPFTSTSSTASTTAVNPAPDGHEGGGASTAAPSTPDDTITLDLRLAALVGTIIRLDAPFADFDALVTQRRDEADEFYDVVLPAEPVGRRAG